VPSAVLTGNELAVGFSAPMGDANDARRLGCRATLGAWVPAT